MLILAVGLPGLVYAAGGTAISTTTLPNGETNVAYSQTLTATGGTGPYTWAIISGGLPGGLSLNTSTGVISGTPTASDTTSFTVQVTDSSSPATTATQTLSIAINDQVAVGTTTLADGEVGVAYSQTLAASAGVTPYAWSITTGTLPGGLSLDATTGVISGTPTTAVTAASVTVQVTDAAGGTASQALSITINPALSLTTTTLADGTVGVAYSQTLAAADGVTPYSWSLTTGTLPAGLSLDPTTGTISGNPSAVGTASFTVQATDAAGGTASQALSIAVGNGSLAISTTSLPDAEVGVAYSQTVAAVNGTSPYAWSVTAGSLPGGLSLNTATGEISGTPTTAAASSFTLQVTDSASPAATATQALAITVNPATTLDIATTSLPDGTVGLGYAAMVGVVGGTTPYTWTVSSGTLPAGLALDGTTGTISGTPSAAGASTFTVQVTDSASPAAIASQAFTLTIASGSQQSGGPAAVQAACQNTSAHPGLVALCSVYSSGALPQFVQGVIGRIILKLSGTVNPRGEDMGVKRGNPHEQAEQGEQGTQSAAACPTATATPTPVSTSTPTPGWSFGKLFKKSREHSHGDFQAQQGCQGAQAQGQQDQLQSSTGGSQASSPTSWFGIGRGRHGQRDN